MEINLEKNENEGNKATLNDIRSFYNTKKILSLLNIKKYLKIINYNKKFQNQLGISIELFKKTSGKYIAMETDVFGKEYDLSTNKILFEGYYRDGKKNGKAKEYYENGKIKFKGEYLKGKKWIGDDFDKDGGNLIFKQEIYGTGKKYSLRINYYLKQNF